MLTEKLRSTWNAFKRIREVKIDDKESNLARVLNLVDLIALGVGSTLGLGAYVLAGAVARDLAGPGVTISFIIAALSSCFAGFCYAEFAARVPQAGSAYIYSYVTVGEFIAFSIGWNLILEYVIGASSVATGLVRYIDALFGNVIAKSLREAMPINVSFLGEYPDFPSFLAIVLITALLAAGVRESSWLNNAFTFINLSTITLVIISGSFKATPDNWKIAKADIPEGVEGAGEGGFLPFGVSGIMTGAATCFYGFVGFDCVATTGEEAKNPKRNIPLAIVISLLIIFVAYFSISVVVTMITPYYLLDRDAPFPSIFDRLGWTAIKWIVSCGAVFALCTSLLGAMFPMPRIFYAMAEDGLLFRFMSTVNSHTKTPLIATIVSGGLAGIMSLIFNLRQLIDMMSIGTLMAYSMVSICVLVLRYKEDTPDIPQGNAETEGLFSRLFNLKGIKDSNPSTAAVVKICVTIFSVITVVLCLFTVLTEISLEGAGIFGFLLILLLLSTLLIIMIILRRQPESKDSLYFKVPLVPFIPCLSVLVNLYLMFQLDINTWIRFIVWIIIGYIVYFTYGIKHSVQGLAQENGPAAPASPKT